MGSHYKPLTQLGLAIVSAGSSRQCCYIYTHIREKRYLKTSAELTFVSVIVDLFVVVTVF